MRSVIVVLVAVILFTLRITFRLRQRLLGQRGSSVLVASLEDLVAEHGNNIWVEDEDGNHYRLGTLLSDDAILEGDSFSVTVPIRGPLAKEYTLFKQAAREAST